MGITNDLWISTFSKGMKRMSPEKAQELINIYPELFSDLSEFNCMRLFGFECGDGWFDLLKDLITQIKAVCEREEFRDPFEDEPIQLKVDQVKEKYGTLRFYTNFDPESIDQLVKEAESRSAITCEDCGKPGSIREKHHWYRVRCDECWDNWK